MYGADNIHMHNTNDNQTVQTFQRINRITADSSELIFKFQTTKNGYAKKGEDVCGIFQLAINAASRHFLVYHMYVLQAWYMVIISAHKQYSTSTK